MATRFYVASSSGGTPVSPSFSSLWDSAGRNTRFLMWPEGENPGTETLTDWADPASGTRTLTFTNISSFQFVCALPCKAQTLTANIDLNFKVGALWFSAIDMCVVARVVDSTGAAQTTLGSVLGNSGATIHQSKPNKDSLPITVTVGTETVNRGDYLVIEIGYYHWPASSSEQSVEWEFGDDHASDLVGDSDTTGRPWIEFGDTITFATGYDYIVEPESSKLGIGIE